ncbi:MAG: hypothetical protein ACI94Y_004248 [Maribacter sp.]|jgi:hypothetical protein
MNLYLAVFALQTNVSSNCLIFRSYEFLTIRKPINSQYNYTNRQTIQRSHSGWKMGG